MKEWSAYVQLFKENGYEIIYSSIETGQDFFNYTPDKFDIIVGNPPFSKKDLVLKRCYELNKPFMLLLPLPSLQGIGRHKLFRGGYRTIGI